MTLANNTRLYHLSVEDSPAVYLRRGAFQWLMDSFRASRTANSEDLLVHRSMEPDTAFVSKNDAL